MTNITPSLSLDNSLLGYRTQNNFTHFQRDFDKTPTEKEAREAAENFEQVFVNNFLKNIFKDVDANPYGDDSNADKIYQDLLLSEYSKTIVNGGGIGIADQVFKQLTQVQGITSDDSKSSR